MEVWKYQYAFNPLYRRYCELLKTGPDQVRSVKDIPFLPIVMFREHSIRTGNWEAEKIFRSSGTTGAVQSRHLVPDLQWYHEVAEKCFCNAFKQPGEFTWLGLLPSYLERADSSLVDMVYHFMSLGGYASNGFFPQVNDEIKHSLHALKGRDHPVVLIGVSFALLDLFESEDVPVWEKLMVIETGGMKGRGREITREELYISLRRHYPSLQIASEYGMTELLSQAYRTVDHYYPGPTMRVCMRDISDPLKLIGHRQRGVINVIDLANIDSCAFIATDDVGMSFTDGGFDVLGRLDNSDLRGCNLLYV